uniref:Uncharacterized protein n=1 Tax=Chrysotila carterae TaxID=13221 RepID=A0A7S4F4U1_CHRCT
MACLLARCPCCRAVLESNYIPKVNVLLWNLIQNSFSAQIKQHANAKLSKATEALELARRDGALRDRLRAEMLQHRDVLVAANPQYFQTLELELKRPTSEIFRCECLQRFICLRKRVSNLSSTSFGREYVGCPLYSSVDPSRGCRFYTNIV